MPKSKIKVENKLLELSCELNEVKSKKKDTSKIEKILWNTMQLLSNANSQTKLKMFQLCKEKGHPIIKERGQCFCGINLNLEKRKEFEKKKLLNKNTK